METEFLVYIAAVYAFAGFVKGFSGMGFSAISIGILATFLELTTAIPLVVIPSLASSLLVVVEAGNVAKAIGKFWPLYLAAFPGLALGLWLLVDVGSVVAKPMLGVLLLVYALWALLNPSFKLSTKNQQALRTPVGFLTGFFAGLTGVAVMPVSPYLLSLKLSPATYVQALNIIFILVSLVLIFALGGLGYLSTKVLVISLLSILPVTYAVKIGSRLRRRASERLFRIAVLFVLLLLGINLVAFT